LPLHYVNVIRVTLNTYTLLIVTMRADNWSCRTRVRHEMYLDKQLELQVRFRTLQLLCTQQQAFHSISVISVAN